MTERKQERLGELSAQLGAVQEELTRTERSVAALRGARNALYAELVREEHGIVVGDLVAWSGEQQLRDRRRPVTFRGMVMDVPMQDRLLVRRMNRDGEPMEQTVCVPVEALVGSGR